jgi:serine/threonine-protein kinase
MRYCARCRTSYAQGERFCPLDGGAVIEEGQRSSLIGETLGGRYQLVREIGKGGMGVVYEAEHTGLGKHVAVKLLLDTYSEDREVLARFHQEARTASRIGHENIIDIIDIGDHNGRSYIVMELLDGTDLRRSTLGNPLTVERGIPIFKQICRALAAAHAKDIIHRDMKPENVFLTERNGNHDFVKLMDFGISKIKAAHESQVRLTQTGAVVGTPLYMAPEQALGKTDIDHRVDIYSVGVMMYELFTGRPPFEANTYLGLLTQHVHERPTSPRKVRPELPAPLERTILRALEKDPAKRFSSIEEMAGSLPVTAPMNVPATVVSGSGSHSGPFKIGATERSTRHLATARSARTIWIGVSAAAVVAAGVVAAVLVTRGGSGTETVAPAQGAATGGGGPVREGPAVVALATHGTLDLKSVPPGARVLLDGNEAGFTPLFLREVAIGEHSLRLELDGYVPVEVQKMVRADVAETFVLTPHTPATRERERERERERARDRSRDRSAGGAAAVPTPAPSPSPWPSPSPVASPSPSPAPSPVASPSPSPTPTKRRDKKDDEDKPNPYLDDKPNPYDD